MKRWIVSCSTLAGLLLFGFGTAFATPTVWSSAVGGNGHAYELVWFYADKLTWLESKAEAETMTFNGATGYLATLTSQAENEFVTSLLPNTAPFRMPLVSLQWFVGGHQTPGAAEPGGGWTWITGETWNYTNWNTPIQPDNNPYFPLGENALSIYSAGAHPGTWNDCPDYTTDMPMEWEQIGGYIVEYSVPEPASLSLLTLVAGAFIRRR